MDAAGGGAGAERMGGILMHMLLRTTSGPCAEFPLGEKQAYVSPPPKRSGERDGGIGIYGAAERVKAYVESSSSVQASLDSADTVTIRARFEFFAAAAATTAATAARGFGAVNDT